MENNLYLLFIRLWLYIRALQSAQEKGELMAESFEPTFGVWLGVPLHRFWDGGDIGHTWLISACKQEQPCK
jgi:hypothetical protein